MKKVYLPFLIFFLLIGFIDSFAQSFEKISDDNNFKLTNRDSTFLDTLQYKTFLYFLDECNPENGLVKDRSTENSPSSIAAVGFALPVWAIGSEHNWITRNKAVDLTLAALKFFWSAPQNSDTSATGYKGFFYHFLDMKTGKRFRQCELSTIDTGLLLAGIIFARRYYNQSSPRETLIRTLANKIINRVDWSYFVLPDTGQFASALSMSWRPGKGYGRGKWLGYNEALILYIIAAGSNTDRIQKGYETWLSNYKWREPYGESDLAHVIFPPLFGHQYSHMFIDFRKIADDYMKGKGIDYFENSRRATQTQRRYAMDNPNGWKGYDSLTWGLTACDGPGPSYNFDKKEFKRYSARGTSGPDAVHNDDGTIAPTAAGGSIVFAPEIVIPTLEEMYNRYGEKGLWGKYGFVDAFNPTVNWYDDNYLGIDQGPIVIMIENLRNGFVWKYVMQDSLIQNGLKLLNFSKINN